MQRIVGSIFAFKTIINAFIYFTLRQSRNSDTESERLIYWLNPAICEASSTIDLQLYLLLTTFFILCLLTPYINFVAQFRLSFDLPIQSFSSTLTLFNLFRRPICCISHVLPLVTVNTFQYLIISINVSLNICPLVFRSC